MIETAEELLKPFTDPDACRYGLQHQWIENGWRMATDGRVAVRIKTGEPDFKPTDDEGRPLKFPNMESIFKQWESHFESQLAFNPMEQQQCGVCDTTGRMSRICEECDGDGRVTCHTCEHEHECDNCDGTGDAVVPCESCKNITVTSTREIDTLFWYRIQRLGEVSMRHVKDQSLFIFKCGDLLGQGIVMHRKTDEDRY